MRLRLGRRTIGDGAPCFIVAEAGVNHNGDVDRAFKMVRVAKQSGADAIKFQSFNPEALATATAPLAVYQRRSSGRQRSQVEMLRGLALNEDEQRQIERACQSAGITFLSTPFDDASARFLADLGVPAFKIGSGDLTNIPLLRLVAGFGRPMFVSTGMGTMEEVEEAVRTVKRGGHSKLVVLQCTTAYPERAMDANVRVIPEYRRKLRTLVGFSDHTIGFTAAVAAVALGACVVEKHFTLSRRLPGPDHRASLEPAELRRFVAHIREAEAVLGDGRKRVLPIERPNIVPARKSVVATIAIPAGTRIRSSMLAIKRPGSGIPPRDVRKVIGKIARVNIPADSLISWRQVQP